MQEPSPLFFDELASIFSFERLNGYLNRAQSNYDKKVALSAYSWNIELSQSLAFVKIALIKMIGG